MEMDDKILIKVLKYISVKPRTQKEIETYLSKKQNLPDTEIQEIIDYLKKNNLIDESFLKESYIKSRVSKGFGRKYIKFKLAIKGIEVDDDEIEIDTDKVVEIVKRKYSKEIEKDKDKAKRKIFNFLSYRGFSKGEILNIMKKIFN